jgi:hypothetical protein
MVDLLLMILGFVAGLIGALAGLGGGIIITPVLALHFGIPLRVAVGTSLVAVITTSVASSAVHLQRHTTDIRLGMTLELATALGAAIAAYFAGYVNRGVLEVLFAAFLLYAAISLLRGKGGDEGVEPSLTEVPDYTPKNYPLGLGSSLIAGALSGLLGIGGGPIKVPVMYLFMEVPLIVATATSNFMIGVTAASSGFVYFRRGDIQASIAAPLAVGVFGGSLLGARLAPKVKAKYVVYLLVIVMFYLAGNMLLHFYREFVR